MLEKPLAEFAISPACARGGCAAKKEEGKKEAAKKSPEALPDSKPLERRRRHQEISNDDVIAFPRIGGADRRYLLIHGCFAFFNIPLTLAHDVYSDLASGDYPSCVFLRSFFWHRILFPGLKGIRSFLSIGGSTHRPPTHPRVFFSHDELFRLPGE